MKYTIIFATLTLLLATKITSGMDPEKTIAAETNPGQAAIASVALVLDVSINDLKKFSQIDTTEIENVRYEENESSKMYVANLKNGDTVVADLCISGHHNGTIYCYRSAKAIDKPVLIPLDDGMYNRLRNLYEAQKKSSQQ